MTDDPLNEIRELIEQARREGRPLQYGERECCFCHADLGGSWLTLRISPKDGPPMMIRLCRHCAARFDVETGIFGLVKRE